MKKVYTNKRNNKLAGKANNIIYSRGQTILLLVFVFPLTHPGRAQVDSSDITNEKSHILNGKPSKSFYLFIAEGNLFMNDK